MSLLILGTLPLVERTQKDSWISLKNGPTGAVVRASPSYDNYEANWNGQTGKQDHVLSQADALTKNQFTNCLIFETNPHSAQVAKMTAKQQKYSNLSNIVETPLKHFKRPLKFL